MSLSNRVRQEIEHGATDRIESTLGQSPFARMNRELEERLRLRRELSPYHTEIATRSNEITEALRALSDLPLSIRDWASPAVDALSAKQTLIGGVPITELVASSSLPSFDSALLSAQSAWVDALSEQLKITSLSTLALGIAGTDSGLNLDFGRLTPEIEDVFAGFAAEHPNAFKGISSFEAVAHDIAVGLRQSVEGEVPSSETITEFLRALFARYGLVDEQGNFQLSLALPVIFFALASGAGGEIIGGAVNRFFDAPAQAEERTHDLETAARVRRMERDLQRLREIADNPPRHATVTRPAWLREAPGTAAAKKVRLSVGTSLIVRGAKHGWLRVDAEPVPGVIHSGWVYGALTRYSSDRS